MKPHHSTLVRFEPPSPVKFNHLLTALFAFLTLAVGVYAAHQRPPNIVLFADNLGWGDLGRQEHPLLTPKIDRLTATGCPFDQFCGSAPVGSSSRAGLNTGRIQNRFGMQGLINTGGGNWPPSPIAADRAEQWTMKKLNPEIAQRLLGQVSGSYSKVARFVNPEMVVPAGREP